MMASLRLIRSDTTDERDSIPFPGRDAEHRPRREGRLIRPGVEVEAEPEPIIDAAAMANDALDRIERELEALERMVDDGPPPVRFFFDAEDDGPRAA